MSERSDSIITPLLLCIKYGIYDLIKIPSQGVDGPTDIVFVFVGDLVFVQQDEDIPVGIWTSIATCL